MKLAEAIAKQEKSLEKLKKTNTNMRKKGLRKGNIESYLKGLESRWEEIRNLDLEIEEVKSDGSADLPYFNGWLEEAEEEFLEQRGLLLEALHECETATGNSTPSNEATNTTISNRIHYRKLPQMDLPNFSGNYSQWASFKNLFLSMLQDGDLTDVDRLQYLRASLSGEAAQLIKNLPITAENYSRAWQKLTDQYENTRLIVNSCLNSLFQIQPLAKESEHGLNTLRGTTNDVIEILTSLKRPVESWDDFLIYITVQRLDPKTRRDWETSVANTSTPSTYKELDAFLISRIQALKSIEHSQESFLNNTSTSSSNKALTTRINSGKVSAHNTIQQVNVDCKFCNQNHYIAACDRFKLLDISSRKDFVTNNRLCYNCLGTHGVRDCRSKKTCYHCHGKHHSLLHFSTNANLGSNHKVESNVTLTPDATPFTPALLEMPSENNETQDYNEESINVHTSNTGAPSARGLMLMATAQIVVSFGEKRVRLRALIDPCSDASFIKESIVQLLHASRQPAIIPVGGIGGGISKMVKSQTSVFISPHFGEDYRLRISALILSKLSDYAPPRHCSLLHVDFLDKLNLADPQYLSNAPIDMVLGLDVYTHIILPGLHKDSTSLIIAQETILGWILSGDCLESSKKAKPVVKCHSVISNEDLLYALNRFWEQEEVPVESKSCLTQEELDCETHFIRTVNRDGQGRYVLRLPFNNHLSELADSYYAAERMLLRMERRFATDKKFFELYKAFIDEYIQLGHAEYIDPSELGNRKPFYLPHHGVLKGSGSETKIRVVFNGSVQLKGYNLNSCLHAGPKLLLELRDVIQLWRMLAYVWKSDVVKMFRQILIDPDDQCYTLILWRESPMSNIRIIRLRTVTYGLICAPYQALRTLRQLSQDEGHRFPLAKEVVDKRTYMDDSFGGANCLDEAKLQQNQYAELLMAGGFPLSKWAANHPQLLEGVKRDVISLSPIEDAERHTVFGLVWHPASDTFSYNIDWLSTFTPIIDLTKRQVSAQAAKLYDPLGWISPVIVVFKIFLQSLWTMGIRWDDAIPRHRVEDWRRLTAQLPELSQISIPRHVGKTELLSAIEIHGFSDASEKAMGAVIYLRVRGAKMSSTCNILISKTRVAPLKQISLPRLELNAAFLLAKMVKNQVEALSLQEVPKFLWSDSTVTLSWIQGHPTRWTTYVANRVASIQSAVPDAIWSHVLGSQNPADLASRGTTVQGLILNAEFWLTGPEFLRSTNEPWRADSNFSPLRECPEERRRTHLSTKVKTEWDLLTRYSSLNKLLKVTARCQEFVSNLKQSSQSAHSAKVNQRKLNVLSPEQLNDAEMFWVTSVQDSYFAEELRALRNKLDISRKSNIFKLRPFIDQRGHLRLNGRLYHALIDDNNKYPLILPKDSIFSKLLIIDAHLRTLHGGTTQVLNTLRQRYWIVNGRLAVKTVISSCIPCWKAKPNASTQLMGDLPATRVRPARAFLHAGVDYAGPISLRTSKGRGVKSFKGYIAIFVCFSTRAVHLEAASDYSSEEFIAVYKRFIGRRGISATLYSDCGTNFVGADRQLRELFQQAGASDKRISEELLRYRTTWKFNPAGAPHFGGLWESGVKSVKHHLRRVMGETKLTFEELTTLLIQIEACLNSRPLQPLSDDPTDLNMLTPAHFLVGEPLTLLPEPTLLNINDGYLTRWQLVRKMTEDFWRSWSLHYLQSLQMRNKWLTPKTNIKVGDICSVKVETLIPGRWPLGRIIEVHPGPDGLVRVVTVKTATSTFQRPIAKICLLPLPDNHSSTIDEGGRNG